VTVDRLAPFNFTLAERREYEAATLRYTAAAHIENYLDHAGMPAKDLAQRIRKSRSWVSKLLSGRQNATLDTLAEVAWALGAKWKISLVASERRGTPAESDAPPPAWAVQRSGAATISANFVLNASVAQPIEALRFTGQIDIWLSKAILPSIRVISGPRSPDLTVDANAAALIYSPQDTGKYLNSPSASISTSVSEIETKS
jgi:antitoxin component HigA of HigAB toxin-antitoxin module